MTEKKKLSTESYKGVRDFYPEDMFIQNHIFNVIKKTVESFGFVEYGASVLEPAELYRAKSGEEIVNEQTYTFIDRGEREVTLRPEMTPTVARMIAGKRHEIAFPARWYSIPNLFRYERPQRGRLREHWQLNADIFGAKGIEADVEIISLAYSLMKNFGLKDENFEIRINDRRSNLKGIQENQLTPEKNQRILKLLDKKNKIEPEEFKKQTEEILGEVIELAYEEHENTKQIIAKAKKLGMSNVCFDSTLVRGFDYYTGMVFEVYDTNPANPRALFGGGRFDNLTELFGGEPIPAIGFGMGDVGIRNVLETYNLLPQYKTSASLYIAVLDEKVRDEAEKLAMKLREKGANVAVDLSNKKIGDQIKIADKQKIPFVTVIGEDEVKNGKFKVKKLSSGEEKTLSATEIQDFITL